MTGKVYRDILKEERARQGLTQGELADKCRLDIRTIQRIEAGTVNPRSYTRRIINNAIGISSETGNDSVTEGNEKSVLREMFRKRKRIRIITAMAAIIFMLAVLFLAFPDWILFGMPKRVWAPFFYLILFIHLIGIVFTWRCPGCNSLLGDPFNTRYCSKCGLDFEGKGS